MGTTRGFVKQDRGLKNTQPKYAKKARFMRALGLLVLWLAFLAEISAAQNDSVLPPGSYRLGDDHGNCVAFALLR